MMTNSITCAAAISVSLRLGQLDPNGAKLAGHMGIVLHGAVSLVLSILILQKIDFFAFMGVEDYQMFDQARVPIAINFLLMNLAKAMETILNAMGRTKDVFWMKFATLWGVRVGFLMYFVQCWRRDLVGLYTGIAIGNGVLVVLFGYAMAIRYVLRICVFHFVERKTSLLTSFTL